MVIIQILLRLLLYSRRLSNSEIVPEHPSVWSVLCHAILGYVSGREDPRIRDCHLHGCKR